MCQSAPLIDCVTPIDDGVAAPINESAIVWRTGDGQCGIVARAPTEEVNPTTVGGTDIAVGTAYIVILILCKTPSIGAGLVL